MKSFEASTQVAEITTCIQREKLPFIGERHGHGKILVMTKQCFLILMLLLSTQLFAQEADSLDNAFSNPTDLTDQERDRANNFVHQGVKDRAYEEGCKTINDCKSPDDEFPLEMMIGKAYALIGGMLSAGSGGLMPTLDKKSTPEQLKAAETAKLETGAKKVKAEKDTKNDYCMMMAMAYEAVGGMIQQSLQKQADNSTHAGDAQLQALVSLQQTHKTRKKTAAWQGGVYSAVTACYAAMAFTGANWKDPKFIFKASGAAALSTLYILKSKKHSKAAKDVGKVIASLPRAGNGCDPWTRSSCFCSEKTSKDLYPAEYQEVCVLNNGNFDTPKVALGCAAVTENKLQFDKECKCKQTNSCLKSNLKAYNPKFGIAHNLMNEANKTFDLLNSGEFDQGKLDRASLSANMMASQLKKKSEAKIPKPHLTTEQKKMADALKPYMPESMANIAAASNSGYSGGVKDSMPGESALSKITPSVKAKLAEAVGGAYKTSGKKRSSEGFSDGPDFKMPSFGQAPKEQNNAEIISFAEEAISKADVSNAPQTPIFDIISNRYRRSGWQKLERIEK